MTKPIQVRNLMIGRGIPKICIPVIGKNEEEIVEQCRVALEAKAVLIEWRADFYEEIFDSASLKKLAKKIREEIKEVPLLFTIRSKREGGSLDIELDSYKERNLYVAKEKLADIIDVEVCQELEGLSNLIIELKKEGCVVIASHHDFDKTEESQDLRKRLETLQKSGADIVKMAVMPKNVDDVIRLLQETEQFQRKEECPLITMSMGQVGAMSRMTGEIFGSAVTFASAGQASAPGQISVEQLRTILNTVHNHCKNEE